MRDIKKWIRNDLKDYEPYNAKIESYRIKLDANERPFSMPERVKKNIIKWLKDKENLNRYPDTDSLELRKEISKFWNVKTENIICGVGSDQIIEFICKTFLELNDNVVVPSPSFSMYNLTAKLNRANVIEVPLDKDLNYDIDRFIDVCRKEKVKIVFICSPNNPTGTSIKCKNIKKLLDEIDVPVVIDEAYAEFNNETMIPYIDKYPNMIVIRTFSKAYGLAGLRVGYAIANRDFIKSLEIVKPPYNLNTLSQKIAVETLKHNKTASKMIETIKNERNYLIKKLKDIDYIKVYKSDSNFIYVKSKINIAEKLKFKLILIRDFGKKENAYISRITVGDRQQNKELLKCLKNLK